MSWHLNNLTTPDTTDLDQYDCWQRAEEDRYLIVALREKAAEYRAAGHPGLETAIVTLTELATSLQRRASRFQQVVDALNSANTPDGES